MKTRVLGIAAILFALTACGAPERSAAPAPIGTPSTASSDTSTEPPVTGPGARKSTRVCVVNRDEIGLWQNYVQWTKFDTKSGDSMAYGETVCAEGGSALGKDVIGTMHLSDGKRESWLEVKVSGDNRAGWELLEPPTIDLFGAGLNKWWTLSVGDTYFATTTQAGAPARTFKLERLPDTAWKELRVTILSSAS